jgi:hypothetical protein
MQKRTLWVFAGATTGHLCISGILFYAFFAYGMASAGFNGQKYTASSRASLNAFGVWNAGYTYGWNGVKDRLLPAIPPPQAFPKIGDTEGMALYRPYLYESVRIHNIRKRWDEAAFVSWACLFGLSIAFIDSLLRKRMEAVRTLHNKSPDPTPLSVTPVAGQPPRQP